MIGHTARRYKPSGGPWCSTWCSTWCPCPAGDLVLDLVPLRLVAVRS